MADDIRTMLVACLFMTGCGDARLPEYELTGPVMGTSYSITLVDPANDVDTEGLAASIGERLEVIEERFSTYRATSELSRINKTLTTGWIPVSAELCRAVESSIELSRRTNGAFDITVGPLVLLWGFGPDGDRAEPPLDDVLAEARSSVGFEKLDTDCSKPAIRKALPGVYIDLSAFAKGYAVDQVAALLDAASIPDFLVEIGGELCTRGRNGAREPWAIAIERPDTENRIVHAIVRVSDRCMATSGDYRNFFEHDGIRYSHTIDPATGRPVIHDTSAVTVVAGTAAEADGLATALLVHGVDGGFALADSQHIAAYFLVRTDDGFAQQVTRPFEALFK